MSFTNFIKRPVLSTVVSIFFVLLGIIGLVSGGEYQRCGEHDLYDLFRV